LGGISSFELKTITITNYKQHRLLDSSTLGFDGTTFCSLIVGSNGTTFCSPIVGLMEQHFAPQLLILMKQHFVPQLSTLMEQHFAPHLSYYPLIVDQTFERGA
jgi:hypothetical protein